MSSTSAPERWRLIPRLSRVSRLVLLLFVSGCSEPYAWIKAGASNDDFRRDAYECERDTRMAATSFGAGLAGQVDARNFYEKCLLARGYSKASTTAYGQRDSTGARVSDGDEVMCNTPDNRPVYRTSAKACVAAGGEIRSRVR
jgi:hypothetical protein